MAETRTVGDDVIDFELSDLEGNVHSSAEARNEGLLLFAIYKKGCGTCRFTLPFLERFHETYAGPGFALWGVSQDSPQESREFGREFGIRFPLLIDLDLGVTEAYGLITVPGIYLVDGSGFIIRHTPAFIKTELNEMARIVADSTGRPYAPIVRPEDDAPDLKPG